MSVTVLLMSLWAAEAPTAPATGRTATSPLVFTSNQYGYRIALPADWAVRVPKAGPAQLRAFGPVDRGPITPNVFVRVGVNRHRTPAKGALAALGKLTAQRRRALADAKPPCKILGQETAQLPTGLFVTRIRFRRSSRGATVQGLMISAVGTYYNYQFTFFTRAEDHAKDDPVFETIGSSIFLLPAPMVPPPAVAALLEPRKDGIGELHYARRVGWVRPLGWQRQYRRANWLKREPAEQRLVLEAAPELSDEQAKDGKARPVCLITAEDTLRTMTATNRKAFIEEWTKLLTDGYKPTKLYRAEPLELPGEGVTACQVVLTYQDDKLGPTRLMQVVAFKHFTRYTLLVLCPETQVKQYQPALRTLTEFLRIW